MTKPGDAMQVLAGAARRAMAGRGGGRPGGSMVSEQQQEAGVVALAPGQRFVVSLPELRCASGHALAVYGDITNYVGA